MANFNKVRFLGNPLKCDNNMNTVFTDLFGVWTGGGSELLFGNKKEIKVDLPNRTDGAEWTVKLLVPWIKENLLQGKEELFVQNGSVRPGILVLINDTDWELLGGESYKLQANDTILFISTLHGG